MTAKEYEQTLSPPASTLALATMTEDEIAAFNLARFTNAQIAAGMTERAVDQQGG